MTEHQHEVHSIFYLKGKLGYDLASCRHCFFVASAAVTQSNVSISIELQEWREPTEKEADSLPPSLA